jgi:hypothetical protein
MHARQQATAGRVRVRKMDSVRRASALCLPFTPRRQKTVPARQPAAQNRRSQRCQACSAVAEERRACAFEPRLFCCAHARRARCYAMRARSAATMPPF